MSVIIETTIGDITIDLLTDERPTTCMNFLKLCKAKYYNHNLMYSVQRNFIAQTGDPTGTGSGGSSVFYKMYGNKARFYGGEEKPVLKHKDIGTVSMVSCGDNMFGSQFFITLGENLDSLDKEHLVFGRVAEGMDVLAKLNQVIGDEENRPYKDIRITHTVILHDPYDDVDIEYPCSPEPTLEILNSSHIAIDEDVNDYQGMTEEEVAEQIARKEAEARSTILEMIGDLPEADAAPPDNVLFVCKLNPVTTSEDLLIIFSRFGEIDSCEVIKDQKTGNSLQYAFIEFKDPKSCEDAYFKMDNVLIDERRIHVDFSQSVSKSYTWKNASYTDTKVNKFDKRKEIDRNHKHSHSKENSRHRDEKHDHRKRDRYFDEKYEKNNKMGNDHEYKRNRINSYDKNNRDRHKEAHAYKDQRVSDRSKKSYETEERRTEERYYREKDYKEEQRYRDDRLKSREEEHYYRENERKRYGEERLKNEEGERNYRERDKSYTKDNDADSKRKRKYQELDRNKKENDFSKQKKHRKHDREGEKPSDSDRDLEEEKQLMKKLTKQLKKKKSKKNKYHSSSDSSCSEDDSHSDSSSSDSSSAKHKKRKKLKKKKSKHKKKGKKKHRVPSESSSNSD